MKQWIGGGTILLLFILGTFLNVRAASAASENELAEKVKSQTSDPVKQVYYADYDHDGTSEAFIITEESDEIQTLWFSGEKEVKKLATSMIRVYKTSQGICQVTAKQKLFVAEGSAGGSGSWSYCCYVKQGRAVLVKRAGECLTHDSGKDFSVYQSAFDATYDGTDKYYLGHTWKEYYLRWNGTKFVEYKGREIQRKKLESYKDAAGYVKQVEKLGFRIGKIYVRKNGVINVNVSKKLKSSDIHYDNFSLNVKGKKVTLRICNKKGKDILEKSGFGGIYRSSGFPNRCTIPDSMLKN